MLDYKLNRPAIKLGDWNFAGRLDFLSDGTPVAMTTAATVAGFAWSATGAGVRLVTRIPQMQHRAWERRAELEEVAWQALQQRGVGTDDLAARAAVTVVMGLGWQAIAAWAHDDGSQSLPSVLTRLLFALPHSARFTAALLDEA